MKLPPELEEVRRRVRVLRDRVLVSPLQYQHPLLYTQGVDVQKGVVVAVGYGRRQRRKTPFHQKERGLGDSKTLFFEDGSETGKILPMQVKPGDVVEFSFRNYTIVDFDRIMDMPSRGPKGSLRSAVMRFPTQAFPGVGDLVFVWQSAIMSVDTEESLSDGLLWQQSAGYDRHGHFMSGAEAWDRG